MAADRQRLAQALAAEAARRKMFESIPEAAGQGLPQAPERPMGWNDYLENLSIGLGRGRVRDLENLKEAVTHPIETAKGFATGVAEAVRNPRMIAEALKQTGQRAMSGPLGLGEVIGENVNMMRVPGKPVMHQITSKDQNLVDIFNKSAKQEIELSNKRIVDPNEPYLSHQPISDIKELDELTDPIFNYAKANVLKHIGEKNGFKVKIEASNVSPSVYAKFTKTDDEGLTNFKVRISDHSDVSRNKPAGEKKAYDINPDSNGSMEEIMQLLNNSDWLKQFYEPD